MPEQNEPKTKLSENALESRVYADKPRDRRDFIKNIINEKATIKAGSFFESAQKGSSTIQSLEPSSLTEPTVTVGKAGVFYDKIIAEKAPKLDENGKRSAINIIQPGTGKTGSFEL